MASYEKTRTKIFSHMQHILQHTLDELPYTNANLPSEINDAKDAMDWLFNVLYPKSKPSVATPADLPTGVDTPNVGDLPPDPKDMRFVNDDGDGNAALYQWLKYDGDLAYEWKKIADMDWGVSGVVSALIDQTQPLYVMKFGTTDYDLDTELPLAGDLAGQHIYGGDTANQHLTLHANNGDDPGVHTGFVQVDDGFRPLADLTYDLGTATNRWDNAYIGTAVIGTGTMTITSSAVTGLITDSSGVISFDNEDLVTTGDFECGNLTAGNSLIVDTGFDTITISVGSITDSTGAISFGDENLSTTGTLASGALTVSSDMVIDTGSITSVSGAISFGDENLSTTGTLSAGDVDFTLLDVDDIRIDGSTISVTTLDTDLVLAANGTGVVDINSTINALSADFVGAVGITGDLTVDSISIDADIISSATGEINVDDHVVSNADGSYSLGLAASRFSTAYLSTSISDGTDAITMATLLSLKDILVRDVGGAIQTGDAIFWDGAKFVASNPDNEISHSELNAASLTADDHAQYFNINGRVGGQTAYGGTATTNTLILGDNSVDDNQVEVSAAGFRPVADASYALGSVSNRWNNLYMNGQAIGMRLENATPAAISAAANATTAGRAWYGTDGFVYVDRGGTAAKIGHNTYNSVHTNVVLSAPVVVTPTVSDPRNCIWQLCDIANAEEVMNVPITKTATQVIINNSIALPAGNYRLIGIEL